MPARNPEAVRQRAIAASRQRSGQPLSPTLDPVFVALNPGALPARARSEAELYQWVRRKEQYATLGANVTQAGVQSTFVGIPLTCRPKGQQYTLTVPAPEGQAWIEGTAASLSGYVLLVRKSDTLSTSPVAPLQIVLP